MDFDEKIYDLIERYLDNDLKGEELRQFEAEKNANEALAKEIKLNAEMRKMLADTPENDLRQNLQKLNNQYKEEKKAPIKINRNKNSSVRYLLQIAALILIGGMLWWFFNKSNNLPDRDEPQIVDTPKDTFPKTKDDPKEDSKNSNIVEDNLEQKEPEIKEPNNKTQKELPLEKKKEPQLYAANFETNPSLDFLIDNNLRSNDFELLIDKKVKNISLSSLEDIVAFRFSGTMKSSDNLLNTKFKIHIFSNKKLDYEDFKSLSTSDLKLKKVGGDYVFDFKKSILLPPGLYYYILEDENEKTYFVEKFEVRL